MSEMLKCDAPGALQIIIPVVVFGGFGLLLLVVMLASRPRKKRKT